MSFGYTTIDGERMEVHVAADYGRMNNQFQADTGYRLVCTSGVRDRATQTYLYNGWINRLPGFNLAAHPDSPSAYHTDYNPSGPRAIDVADTGPDWGVSRRGTARDGWMQRNAGRFNFENEGYGFTPVEAWHKKWIGSFTGGAPAGGGSTPLSEKTLREQQFLNAVFKAGLVEDGIPGPATTAATASYQTFLNDKGYADPKLVVDGDWGDKTQAAHAKYYPVWVASQTPPAGPAFPLPAGYYFGPEDGPAESISGYHSYPDALGPWQQRMKDRGWTITVDSRYGPETAGVAHAFQLEKGLTVDSKIGPQTWQAAWTAPITGPTNPAPLPETPPAPVPPEKVPVLVTPTAADFPAWIRYEEKFDQQWSAEKDGWNAKLEAYYGVPYEPIESHTHWWNLPGKGGSHDGNVDYLNRTADVGANYVTSAGRVTLTMPLEYIALTTGRGNPRAWKSENDPDITVAANGELGYKTLGALHYIVEKKNPRLRQEAIRLHKEVLPGTTSCSDIDTAVVRRYAEQFHSGALDIATGLPPVVVTPPPVEPPASTLGEQIAEAYRELGDLLEQLPEGV